MLHLILGPAGSGKTYWVRQRIAQLVGQGKGDLLLLVPEQNNYESERAMLTLLGSASTDVVEVVSFTRLADLAQDGDVAARDAAPDGVKVMLMGRALRAVKTELSTYARHADSPEFCQAVLDLDEELRRSRIDTDALCAAAESAGGALAARMRDLSLLIAAYRALLEVRFRDPLDDLDRLVRVLDESAPFRGKTVFIDAFKGFTEQQFAILERVIAQADEVYLALCADSLEDKEHGMGLFSNVKRTAARLIASARERGVGVAAPLVLTEDHRFGGNRIACVEQLLRGVEPVLADDSGVVTICACANGVDEADFVARTIRRLVRTEGYRYRDFAVIARHMEADQALLVNACERYRVPCFNDRRVSADSLALIRFVLHAIDCALHGYPAEAVYSLIKSELSPLSVEESSELESYALMWNKRGRDWLAPWEGNPNGLEPEFDQTALDRILASREKIVQPVESLASALRSCAPRTICRALYDFLKALAVDERLAAYAARLDEEGDSYYADLHRQSWDVLMASLDYAVRALEGETCEGEEFYALFSLLLTASDLGAIPDRLDEVVIGSADRIRIGAPRVVFVIGANFGVFPSSTKPVGLLSNNDRRRLIRGGLAMPDYAREHAVDERFMAYTALTGASERLYVSYRVTTLGGEAMSSGEFVDLLKNGVPGAVFLRSRETADDAFEGVLPAVERVCGDKPALADALARQLRQRQDPRGDLLDAALHPAPPASLSPEMAHRLFGRDIRMSASRAEEYGKCPFGFFCKYGVRARPDRSAEWDVLRRGTLVHYVLENALRTHGAALADLPAEQRREEIAAWIRTYADQTFGGYDRLDAAFLYLLERAAITLDDVLGRIAADFAQSEYRPDRCELPIGQGEDVSLTLPLTDGSVILRGSVDRVDVYQADGRTYVRVVDYKTGKKTFDVSELFYGINMQMLLYLFAVAESNLYEHAVPSGVLYLPSRRQSVDQTGEDAQKARQAALRMNGLLLDDPVSLTAMEPAGEGRFVPYTPDGKKNSVASEAAFEALRSFVMGRLGEIGERLHRGEVAADPLTMPYGLSCEYCDYRAVCRHGDESGRQMEKIGLAEALARVQEEVDARGL